MEPLHGLLEMLVLKTLILGPVHGYGIARAIRTRSNEALEIEFGSLYPALKRLELKGFITSKWETSEHNKRAKYYRLSNAGRKRLRQEQSEWERFASGVALLMNPASEGQK